MFHRGRWPKKETVSPMSLTPHQRAALVELFEGEGAQYIPIGTARRMVANELIRRFVDPRRPQAELYALKRKGEQWARALVERRKLSQGDEAEKAKKGRPAW